MLLERLHQGPKPIPESRFSVEVERERMRADRTGRQFSLVIFRRDPGTGPDRELLEDLRLRVRSTDSIGLLDTGELAALLPETSSEGAAAFARQVCGLGSSPIRRYRLYTYPSGRSREGVTGGGVEGAANGDSALIDRLFLEPISRWKRLGDVVGAVVLLVIASPLLLAGALITRLGSPGPVILKQPRVGFAGRTFAMWKFRTMRVDTSAKTHAEYFHTLVGSAEPMTKIDDELPLTPLGKLLRKTYIDELPQLVNVIRGEMSLVGPRPCLPYEEEKYQPWHRERFQTLPGMTGLWQVSGKNRTTFVQMMRLDVRYSRRHSFWLDLWILIKTLPVVLFESGKRSLFSRTEEKKQC